MRTDPECVTFSVLIGINVPAEGRCRKTTVVKIVDARHGSLGHISQVKSPCRPFTAYRAFGKPSAIAARYDSEDNEI
jgi:hypothetical protein